VLAGVLCWFFIDPDQGLEGPFSIDDMKIDH